ncbi:MAG: nuclear transport factor 2 family protein [Deltaproteobacteria bacterium]|nr:nuclear transport factor 2 family protein [Deltaproteobacteria bacterium]
MVDKMADTLERESVENVVREFFEGISALDYERIAMQTTEDFQLLEHGEVWTLDNLVNVLKDSEPVLVERINTFDFIEYKQVGAMAWISYWNRADIKMLKQDRLARWLESAVCVKEAETWKMQLLHSTIIENTIQSKDP